MLVLMSKGLEHASHALCKHSKSFKGISMPHEINSNQKHIGIRHIYTHSNGKIHMA